MSDSRHDATPEPRGDPVVVVPYDPAWPRTFDALATQLAATLGDLAVGIEHVGSTAVPGLAAKPIVDVDVVVRRDEDLADARTRLSAAGYTSLGDLGVAGREAFRAPPGAPRHHLYVCASGAAALRAHLLLRDALRADPDLAVAYGTLKAELAERFRDDRDSYTEGKSAFIRSVLMRERDAGRKRSRRR